MKSTLKNVAVTICLGVSLLTVMAFSLRGRWGNPDTQSFTEREWKENGPFELSPERGRFALLYSLIEEKTPHFSVPVARFATPDLGYKNGKYVSLFAPAVSFAVIPGYLLGKAFDLSQVGSFAVISIFAVINVLLIRAIVGRLTGNKAAGFIAGMAFLFATPAFSYGVTLYQHHISTFLILSSIYLLVTKMNWFKLAAVWVLCALSLPVDYPNVILMLPIGISALTHIIQIAKKRSELSISVSLMRVLTFISVMLPLGFFVWFNSWSYGNPMQLAGTVKSVAAINEQGLPATEKELMSGDTAGLDIVVVGDNRSAAKYFDSRDIVGGLYILLFSPDRGIIVFAPVVLFGAVGICILYKRRPRTAVLLTGVILANILLYSMWGDPWGGWAFGARYLIPAYALLSIGTGVLLSQWRTRRILAVCFVAVMAYSVYVNTAGALSSSANPPQAEVLQLESRTHRQERYSFDRNVEYLKQGYSKAFMYQAFFADKISAWNYVLYVTGAIMVMALISIGALLRSTGKEIDEKE